MAHIIPITDFTLAGTEVYASLTERQLLRDDLFVAESPEVIRLALQGGMKPISFLMEGKYITTTAADLLAVCDDDIPVYTADGAVLSSLTGFHLTRGVLCAFRRPALPDPADLCKNARRVAVLENVMNAANIGAIFRCAAALNIDALLLTEAGGDPLSRRATRTAMGTMFQLPWTVLPGDKSAWEALGEMGFKTAAMVLRDDSVPLNDAALNAEEKLAVILGNEGDGLCDDTVIHCDYAVKIPMSHGVDSLNVATAAAIAFYQLAVL